MPSAKALAVALPFVCSPATTPVVLQEALSVLVNLAAEEGQRPLMVHVVPPVVATLTTHRVLENIVLSCVRTLANLGRCPALLPVLHREVPLSLLVTLLSAYGAVEKVSAAVGTGIGSCGDWQLQLRLMSVLP